MKFILKIMNRFTAILTFFLLTFCYNSVYGQHLVLRGEPIAKTIMWVESDLPDFETNYKVAWFISDSLNGIWDVLPGINTKEIVLLTKYTGKYIKCEITPGVTGKKANSLSQITSTPVVNKGNPNTDWFRIEGVGVMLHFLKAVFVPEGGSKEYNEVVNNFDVEVFDKK